MPLTINKGSTFTQTIYWYLSNCKLSNALEFFPHKIDVGGVLTRGGDSAHPKSFKMAKWYYYLHESNHNFMRKDNSGIAIYYTYPTYRNLSRKFLLIRFCKLIKNGIKHTPKVFHTVLAWCCNAYALFQYYNTRRL